MSEVKKWFKQNVQEPMAVRGVKITLKCVRVNNTLKKPGPVFLEMARTAYKSGADYFYRVNDDTEMLERWPNGFVQALHKLPAPHGVVGPTCGQGNQGILTHDFVSRLHMDIFEMNYYPPQLVDWWMDDWISVVYGQSRTFKAKKYPVMHHTGAHGQRYKVDQSNRKYLDKLILDGRNRIRNWMLKNNVSEHDLKEFDNDRYTVGGFVHRDIPS